MQLFLALIVVYTNQHIGNILHNYWLVQCCSLKGLVWHAISMNVECARILFHIATQSNNANHSLLGTMLLITIENNIMLRKLLLFDLELPANNNYVTRKWCQILF